jgi:ABC-type multidrug transport system fused ATPase/permease subunit
VSSAAYAAAHAGLALIAGALARALITDAPPPEGPASRLLAASPGYLANVGLLIASVKAVAGYFLASSEREIAGQVVQAARLRATDALLEQGTDTSGAAILARVATRSQELEQAVREGALASIRATCQLVPLAAAMILLSPSLSLTATLALVTFGFVAAGARRRWRSRSRSAQQCAERLHREVNELASHVDLWRSYGAGGRIREAIAKAGARALSAEARVAAGRAALSGSNEILAAAALVLAIAVMHRDESVTLLGFAAVFFMAYRPLRDLGDARAWVHHGQEALAALEEIAIRPPARTPLQGAEPGPPADRSRAWAGSPARLVLDGFGAAARGPRTSLVIPPGSVALLRGPTGSGKTTLLRALLGLEPPMGKLQYGDVDLTQAPVGLHGRPFAWVPQEAPLLTGTLRENVGLGDATDEAADAAIETVGLGTLQEQLGVDPIGSGGRPVSGGEKRLIALARALATGHPVLLLDEPTEGLDRPSRERIAEALGRLRGSRTVLVATHRTDLDAIADATFALGTRGALAAE